MKGQLKTYDGLVYTLPVLTEWEIVRTGGVPCDSFTAVCLYEPAMAEVLPKVNRFRGAVDGVSVFYGVVDEYEIAQTKRGLLLTVAGRGLCALLLDNESTAANYQRATTEAILRAHVTPYGLVCKAAKSLYGTYAVSSGVSQWKALDGFTQRYGGFSPYFDCVGNLYIQEKPDRKHIALTDSAPLLSLTKREQRYGVLSEVLVVDKARGISQQVKNQEFLQRGGCCRRVLYTPGKSTYEAMRYTGDYQIQQSCQDQNTVEIQLQGAFLAEPGDLVTLQMARTAISGSYYVSEVRSSLDSGGETCLLTLKER